MALRTDRGFTLVETLIVMMLVSLLTLVAFTVSRSLIDSARLRVETFRLVQGLRLAQAAAFARQSDCTFRLDVKKGLCTIEQAGRVLRSFELEAGMRVVPALSTFPAKAGVIRVVFTPQYGIPRLGGSIALRGAGILRRLIVSAVTGRVRIE